MSVSCVAPSYLAITNVKIKSKLFATITLKDGTPFLLKDGTPSLVLSNNNLDVCTVNDTNIVLKYNINFS